MRHVYVNLAAYLLAALLLVSVLVFAWLRSQDVVVASQDRGAAAMSEEPVEGSEQGAEIFQSDCSGCHEQLTHVPELVAAEDGRSYLAAFMVFGYEGEIVLEGESEDLTHPPFGELGDDELAAVMNHMLVSWGNEDRLPADLEPFRPEEVERIRDEGLEPEDVAAARPRP